MNDRSEHILLQTWFPIATSDDLPKRHVFHGQLLGQELAVWRADDDFINVWENRCLHRGVRLTIGINLGGELKCQYHGWRYANKTAACTYIPAHPANAPATIIKNKRYKALERDGLVWSSINPVTDQPPPLGVAGSASLVLRSIAVRASAPLVAEMLMEYRYLPNGTLNLGSTNCNVSIEPLDAFTLKLNASDGSSETTAILLVQPVEEFRSTIHGVIVGDVPYQIRLAVLSHHNGKMKTIRDTIEESGQVALDMRRSSTKRGASYRQMVAGKFSYGMIA
jgi:nitrite reductase/ring-hydroxylating ferredoxin subunit